MADVRVTINDREFQRKLTGLSQSLTQATALMRQWGEIAQASIAENFEVGGRPTHWQPLAPSTIRSRIGARKNLTRLSRGARRSRSPFRITFLKILFVTGTLSRVTSQPGPTSVKIATQPAARKYAAIHQFGGRAGRGRRTMIPARPYMLLQPEDLEEMRTTARRHLLKAVA